ncbi:hypothetical protein [Levilactobacillus brevis]
MIAFGMLVAVLSNKKDK